MKFLGCKLSGAFRELIYGRELREVKRLTSQNLGSYKLFLVESLLDILIDSINCATIIG